MNEVFRTFHRVRFGECDHAGIVFYPRYGEMSHAVIETWLREGLECDMPTMIERYGVVHPLVTLERGEIRARVPADFSEPMWEHLVKAREKILAGERDLYF